MDSSGQTNTSFPEGLRLAILEVRVPVDDLLGVKTEVACELAIVWSNILVRMMIIEVKEAKITVFTRSKVNEMQSFLLSLSDKQLDEKTNIFVKLKLLIDGSIAQLLRLRDRQSISLGHSPTRFPMLDRGTFPPRVKQRHLTSNDRDVRLL